MNKKVTINNEIRDFVKRALEAFKDGYEGTYFYKLGRSEFHDGIWAIAIGWSDGFDPDDTDGISDGNGFKVCAKLAYSDGYMQSDYDMDWIMPYDEETGDVDDTDSAISANPEDALDYIEWLLKRWNEDYANYVADKEISDSRKVKDSASLSNYDEMDWGSGEEYYVPKETTKVYLNDDEGNEKEVDVWVGIKTTDLAEFMSENDYTENDRFIVEVVCVPTPESLSEETRNAVSDGGDFEPNIADIDGYGYSVSFWYKQCSESEVMSAQEEAAEKAEGFKVMVGFALDKPYNRVGDDGWSILEDACLNKKPNWRR